MKYTIEVQPLTKENFSPFGQVLLRDTGKPLLKETEPQFTDRVSFEIIDGSVEFVYATVKRRSLKFREMERHLKVKQGFFPVSRGNAIMVVAPPTDATDLEAIPSPDSVKAFYLDNTTSVVLHYGTWHGTLFPLAPTFDYILATRKETTDDSFDPKYDSDVQIRDLGVEFEIKL